MTDFRALCTELWDELQYQTDWSIAEELKERARAALAQPEPEWPRPTDEPSTDDILSLAAIIREVDGNHSLGASALAEAILSHRDARWGSHRGILGSSPQPVPVSERLPGPEDCDAEGRCWWWRPSHPESSYSEGWMLRPRAWGSGRYDFDDCLVHTHWLPFNALPQPSGEVSNG